MYSPRQQMGRPRKRRREDDAVTTDADADDEAEGWLPGADNLHDFDIRLGDLTALPEFADFGVGIEDGGDKGMCCSRQDVELFDTSVLTPVSDLE